MDIQDAVVEYVKNKSAENRDHLERRLSDFMDYAVEMASEGDNEPLKKYFEYSLILPFSKRFGNLEFIFDKSISGNKILTKDNLKVPVWDLLPKKSKKPILEKPKKIELNPDNKGLNDLAKRFVLKDDLRPVLECINFDEHGVTMTNAHILLHLAGKTKFEGIYRTEYNIKKEYRKLVKDLGIDQSYEDFKNQYNQLKDEKYPNYLGVIPTEVEKPIEINLPFLASVLNTIYENVLINKTTFQIVFEFDLPKSSHSNEDGKFIIGYNLDFLLRILKTFMDLGETKANLFLSTPTRGSVITRTHVNSMYNLENEDFALIMPVIVGFDYQNTIIDYKSHNTYEIKVGDTLPAIVTPNDFYNKKVEKQEKVTKKEPKSKTSEIKFLKDQIEAFKMMIEIEDDKKEIDFLKEKLDAFKLMLDLEKQ